MPSSGFDVGSGARLVPASWIRGLRLVYSQGATLYSNEGLFWPPGRCRYAPFLYLPLASLLRHWVCVCFGDCLGTRAPFVGGLFSSHHPRGLLCPVLLKTCALDFGTGPLSSPVRDRRVPNTCIGGSGTRTAMLSLWNFAEDSSVESRGRAVAPWAGMHCNPFPSPPFGFSSPKPFRFIRSAYEAWPACCCAPNTCIGGAGTRAFSSVAPYLSIHLPFWPDLLIRFFSEMFSSALWRVGGVSTACLAFFRTLLVLVGIALLTRCNTAQSQAKSLPTIVICPCSTPCRPSSLGRCLPCRCDLRLAPPQTPGLSTQSSATVLLWGPYLQDASMAGWV